MRGRSASSRTRLSCRLALLLVLAGPLMIGPLIMGQALTGQALASSHAPPIDTSDATFAEAVRAVKDKNYTHAVKLFTLQARADQHDAQYNLALLLKSGKGQPQNFQQALIWAWTAWLGGIEKAADLAEELQDLLPEEAIEAAREAVRARLQERISEGQRAALMQFARFHEAMLAEADWSGAYIWYAIAAAVGMDGAIEARDEAMDNLEDGDITALQEQAGKLFEGLELKP